MNPRVRYLVSNPGPGHQDVPRNFTGEFFEVYSPPIRSRYSEVVWRTLAPVPLPEAVRARYNGTVMAITGFELDVVRREGERDVSVPCFESYNHHYTMIIRGRSVRTSERMGEDMGHGPMPVFEEISPRRDLQGRAAVPGVQAFNEHNGNEARQSYHGFPSCFVQLLDSPEEFIFNPMQINTKNPDGSGKRGGPLPRASAAPAGAPYSGLLECPCTTRIKKQLGGYMLRTSGTCRDPSSQPSSNPWDSHHSASGARPLPVASAEECFGAAAGLVGPGRIVANLTSSNQSLPAGCSLIPSRASFAAVFNHVSAAGAAACGGRGARRAYGQASGLVDLTIDVDETSGLVTITMAAQDGKWFGVGFGASRMADLPYTVVVDGSGRVAERTLEDHAPGTLLDPLLTVQSNTVDSGRRTVVVQRPLHGPSSAYYAFSAGMGSLPYINAIGGGPDFAQHVARSASSVALLLARDPTCVCRRAGGTINGIPYDPHCAAPPLSDLAATANPTCDVSTYVGGMECCRDGTFLLDADQDVPSEVDEVFFKVRFYYEDYVPGKHIATVHLEWALNGCDSGGPMGNGMNCRHIEYDVPRSAPGTPPSQAVHEIRSRWVVRDMLAPSCDIRTDPYCADVGSAQSGIFLIMAGGHCHAPACTSLELWDADKGVLLCRVEPRLGQGDDPMDEEGYLWLPPCQWGSASEGLLPPPLLRLDTNLTAVKRANSTYYHYGVMAIWQMRGAFAPAVKDGLFI